MAVALSGGVDSATAAMLLMEEGHEVIGITMMTWSILPKRYTHAYMIAKKLGIEWHLIDVKEEFKQEVVEPFVRGYLKGTTPNPCVICNERIKFNLLLKKADELGAQKLATGHYAKVGYHEGLNRYFIAKSRDPRKDQSYMLYRLQQEQLAKVLFPLGDMTKSRVRELAKVYGISDVHEPRESYDLCFAGPLGLRGFMRRYLKRKLKEGPILNLRGEVIGTHKGIPLYTLGQRRGLNVSLGEPVYVVGFCPDRNAIVVGPKELLEVSSFTLRDIVWGLLPPQEPGSSFKAQVVLRLHSEPIEAVVKVTNATELEVIPEEPAWLVTPGQSAVAYDSEGRILVGGVISSFTPLRAYKLPCAKEG